MTESQIRFAEMQREFQNSTPQQQQEVRKQSLTAFAGRNLAYADRSPLQMQAVQGIREELFRVEQSHLEP